MQVVHVIVPKLHACFLIPSVVVQDLQADFLTSDAAKKVRVDCLTDGAWVCCCDSIP